MLVIKGDPVWLVDIWSLNVQLMFARIAVVYSRHVLPVDCLRGYLAVWPDHLHSHGLPQVPASGNAGRCPLGHWSVLWACACCPHTVIIACFLFAISIHTSKCWFHCNSALQKPDKYLWILDRCQPIVVYCVALHSWNARTHGRRQMQDSYCLVYNLRCSCLAASSVLIFCFRPLETHLWEKLCPCTVHPVSEIRLQYDTYSEGHFYVAGTSESRTSWLELSGLDYPHTFRVLAMVRALFSAGEDAQSPLCLRVRSIVPMILNTDPCH